MKHFGSVLEFTHERNEDLMRVFRLRLAEADFVVMPDIFEKVANSPSSRFWVSEERAAIIISAMLSGRPLPPMRSNRREMFDEIFRRFLIIRNQEPSAPLNSIVARVIAQPAPKFYLTPRSVGEFIYRIKNGWYENGRKTQGE